MSLPLNPNFGQMMSFVITSESVTLLRRELRRPDVVLARLSLDPVQWDRLEDARIQRSMFLADRLVERAAA